MAIDNIGNQTILFDFANPGSSESFNKLNHKVIDPGIYNGMALSVNLAGNSIEVTAGQMIIASGSSTSNYISTSETISWSPSGGWASAPAATTINVAIYWLFTWANVVVNWAELQATTLPASLPANAVVVGTVVIDDTGTLISASTSNRTFGSNRANYFGNLTNLATVEKGSLVGGINEVNTISTFVRNLNYGRAINTPELTIAFKLPFTSFRFPYATVGDNPKAIVNDGNYLWTCNYTANTITKFNPFSGTASTYSTETSSSPIDITSDGTNIWVVNNNLNSVSRISGTTGAILQTIAVGTNPVAIAYANDYVYVVNKNSHSLSKIHKLGSTVVSTISLQSTPSSDNPFPTDIIFSGTNLYVASPASTLGFYLKEVNITTEVVTHFGAAQSLTEDVKELAFDGVYVWGAGTNNIIKWDTPNDLAIATIAKAGVNKLFHNGKRLWYTKANECGSYRDVLEGTPASEYTTAFPAASGNPFGITDDGTHIWVTMEGVGKTKAYRILK